MASVSGFWKGRGILTTAEQPWHTAPRGQLEAVKFRGDQFERKRIAIR